MCGTKSCAILGHSPMIAIVMYSSGLRVSEAVRLRVGDIHRDANLRYRRQRWKRPACRSLGAMPSRAGTILAAVPSQGLFLPQQGLYLQIRQRSFFPNGVGCRCKKCRDCKARHFAHAPSQLCDTSGCHKHRSVSNDGSVGARFSCVNAKVCPSGRSARCDKSL